MYTVLHKYTLYIIQYGQSNLIHFYDDGTLLTTDFYSREENTGGKDHAGENKLSSLLSFTLFQPPQTNKQLFDAKEVPRKLCYWNKYL